MMPPNDCAWVIDVDQPPLPSRDLAAVYFVIVLVVVIGLFEWWAVTHDKHTISQMIQKVMRGRVVWQIFGAIGLAVLGWHLLRGGPL